MASADSGVHGSGRGRRAGGPPLHAGFSCAVEKGSKSDRTKMNSNLLIRLTDPICIHTWETENPRNM